VIDRDEVILSTEKLYAMKAIAWVRCAGNAAFDIGSGLLDLTLGE
jgi:hypothetical protein